MKVAHICGPLVRPAGTERSVVELASEMEKQGVDTRIYTPLLNETLFGGLIQSVDVEQVQVPLLPTFDIYHELYFTKRIISAASKWADAIIFHNCQAMASYAFRKSSIPSVPFYHVDKWDWEQFGLLRPIAPIYARPIIALELRSLREVPIAFATSRSLTQLIRHHEPKAHVVPITIGVDTSRFFPRWEKDDGFVMMAGRFHPTNNFELAIRAMANTGHKMLVAGLVVPRFRWYFDRLEKMVSQDVGLKENISFTTSPPEASLIENLQSCSLFLSPRAYDYLGHAALEPMACGKPVVQHGSPSGLEDDPPVVLCGRDPSEWRSVVLKMMGDPQRRRDLGRKSFEFIEEKHSLRTSVQQLLHHLTLTYSELSPPNGGAC